MMQNIFKNLTTFLARAGVVARRILIEASTLVALVGIKEYIEYISSGEDLFFNKSEKNNGIAVRISLPLDPEHGKIFFSLICDHAPMPSPSTASKQACISPPM